MSDRPLLALDQLKVVYKDVITAIQGVSLEVHKGQIVVLLGTNGAGKTTTLRAISGFIGMDDARVVEGGIRFKGQAIENRPPHLITELGIVLVPERNKIFESLSVAENLEVSVPRRSTHRHAELLERAYEYFPHLTTVRARLAGLLSGGERQMLTMASALMCEPELLLVDELSQGLAPLIVSELLERLQKMRDELDLTVLLVEQNAQVALERADYGYVIENGRVVLDGDMQRLAGHQDIQEFYLGGGKERRSYRHVKQYRRSRRWYG